MQNCSSRTCTVVVHEGISVIPAFSTGHKVEYLKTADEYSVTRSYTFQN